MDMYMAKASPETAEAFAAASRDPATKIILESPHLEFDVVSSLLNKVRGFLKDNLQKVGAVEYILELRFSECPKSTNQLDAKCILASLKKGFNVVQIDSRLMVLALECVSMLSAPEISNYSKVHKCCVVHVLNGVDCRIYHNGLTIKEMNVNSAVSQPLTIKKYSRQAVDYRLSIIDHYKKRIRFAQFSSHWDPPGDKATRILRGNEKTEMIFHRNLWNWLDENLNAVVYGTVNKLSNDQTDIEIRARGPSFYVLEVKWLGFNGKTRYSRARLKKGISQVKNYLDIEPECLEACLVAYDGRKLEKFRQLEQCDGEDAQWKEFKKCDDEEFPARGTGLLLYLESESASTRQK